MSTVYSFPSSLVKELRWHGIRLRFFRRMSEDSAQLIDGGLCVERVVQIDWKWFHQARTVHYSGYWEFACFKDMKAKIYALPICRWLRNHFQGLEKGVVFLWAVLWPSLSLGEKKKWENLGTMLYSWLLFSFYPLLFLCWFLRLACHSFMLSEFFLQLMGPASHRHNNPSNQLPQHPGEIESAHSPY